MGDYPSGDALRAARQAKDWSIAEAARALRAQHGPGRPTVDSLIRSWKRWERGTVPSRFYRTIILDLLGLRTDAEGPDEQLPSSPEIGAVFANQQLAADEIRTQAQHATGIDVLAVRGLGLVALKDALLRPALERRERPAQVRIMLLRPGSDAANRRAVEVGESVETFTAGLELATAHLRELAVASPADIEVYLYDTTPTWRIVALDDIFYVSSFSEDWQGHESVIYKVVPTQAGTLHCSYRRTFDDICQHADRIL